MTSYYDGLETRSADERDAALSEALPEQIARAKALPGYADALGDVDPKSVTSREALAALPVLRKSALGAAQGAAAPFGGFTTRAPSRLRPCLPVAGADLRAGRQGA